jgi:HEAT repeat protein
MSRCLLVAFLLVPLTASAAEPDRSAHGGKSLDYWIDKLHENDPKERRKAVEAVGAIGSRDAMPALVELLQESEYPILPEVAVAIGRIGGPETQFVLRSLMLRQREGGKLDVLSPFLQQFKERNVRQLDILLRDPDADVRRKAAEYLGALASVGRPAVPGLLGAAHDADERVRLAALDALHRIEPAQMDRVLAVAIQMLLDQRLPSYTAVTYFRPVAKTSVAPLVAALDYDNAAARQNVASVLSQLTPESLPLLREALRHARPHVRVGAARALGMAGEHARTALPDVLAALDDGDPAVRLEAAESALLIDGTTAGKVLPTLRSSLSAANAALRVRAVTKLGEFGKAARSAIADLRPLLRDVHAPARLGAALALPAIDEREGPATVPALVDLLSDEDVHVRRRAAEAAGSVGPAANAAVPLLLDALADDNVHLRLTAATALVRIDRKQSGKTVPVIDELLTAKKRPMSAVRGSAIRAAVALGPLARTTAPALKRIMDDEDEHFALQAAAALVAVEPDEAKLGLEFLRRALTHKDADQQDEALAAVCVMGEAARPLVPAMVELLKSKEWYTRRRTAETLDLLGPAAADAVQALREASKDRNAEVAQAATAALRRIEGE